MKHLTAVVICLLSFHQLNAQSISIFGIDASSFPTMKAKFNAFDASWNQQMPSISELSLKENGLPRTITDVTCPVASPPAVVSIAMSFDVSSSMRETIELVKITSTELCSLVAIPTSEFALQTCDGYPLLLQDFTTDRNRILELIPPVTATGDNNFTEHLLNRFAGLLTVAKNGRNKKVAIIFTDAWWPQLSKQELDQCIEFCRVFNIQFISVIYSKPETEPNGIKQSLQALASATGGYMYDGIFSKDAAKEIASRIQADAQGVMDNCEITWESDLICYNGQPVINVELGWNLVKGFSNYILPNDARAILDVSPSYIAFGKVPPQKTIDTTITLTTQNADFTVTDIRTKYGSPIFSVVGASFPFVIPKNESKSITLQCTPVDSSMSYAALEVITDICIGEFSAGSGFSGQKNKSPTLKLIKPNGGEQFLVGNDTLITWEGVAASDTVCLELSRNNGASWTKITDKASGLTYNWKKISKPTSNQCLVKVKLKANDNSPAIEWQKSFGGKGFEQANSIQQTFDGGYIIAGFSDSKDAAITNKGDKDFYILKLNISGTIDWQKTYGGNRDDIAQSIVQTGDGGYIVTGKSLSNFDNPTITKDNYDCWILKLNSKGDSIWQKTYGGNRDEEGLSIQQIASGGYIVAGWSESTDGNFVANKGNSDAWVLKLNSKGEMVSQIILGGSNYDFAQSIYQAKDKSFIVAGHTYSNDFDVTFNKGQYDSWVIKIDSTANSIVWKKTLGGSNNDYAQSIQQTEDGGYVFTGYTNSNNGDVKSNNGGYDYWVVKLDGTCNIEWQKIIGGSRDDKANSIQQTMDGGYIIAGESDSKDGNVSPNKNGKDYWVVKLDPSGEVEWQKSLGGSSADAAKSIKQTSEGGYIIAGVSDSKDGDITANKGSSDFWIVKLSGDGEILQEDQSDAVFSIVSPQAQSRDIDMKQCLLGTKKDSLITDFVSNIGTYRVRIDSIYFRGADAGAFSLASGIPPYFIEPPLSHSVEIRFKPSKVGIHNAETVIVAQSDTLIQKIIGEGIAPSLEVINSVIDFGKVTVNTHKDTLEAVTVRNIGNAPLTITSTRHIGPNDIDFTTLAKGGNFTLLPDETAKLDLRFLPKNIGRTNGRLLFDFEGLGSPATVYLFGEGIKSEAQIKASGFAVPSFTCETEMIDSVRIQNIGVDTLLVRSAVFGGMNPGDFQFVTPFSPMKIARDSIVLLPVRFSPASVGNRSAFLEIHSNSSTDSVLILTLLGTKEDASFTSKVQTINIGILCPNVGKDTSFSLFNSGTLKNTFTLQSKVCTFTAPSIDIGISDSQTLSVYYAGQTNEGTIDETITITDSICGVQKVVRITGSVKRTKIISQQFADFGKVYDGSSSTLEVFAVNKDVRPIVIESPTGINLPFKLDALFPPAGSVLAPDDTVKARIRYDAADGAPGIGYLNWSVILPCPSMDSTELRAQSLRADTLRTTVFVQDITAQAGEKVNLVLKLQKQTGMQIAGAPTEWRARIRYNKSILFNTQTNNACLSASDDNCIIELNDRYNPQSTILASIPCVATLGNTDNSAIIIEDFQWTDGSIVVEEPQKLNGTIRITGICEQGGVRLFIPAKNATSLTTRPNPAQNSIQIQYGLREPLTVTLELLDITGRVVQTIVSNQQQAAGQYTLMNDMSLLGNGVYSLRLSTNKEVLTSRVDVVK